MKSITVMCWITRRRWITSMVLATIIPLPAHLIGSKPMLVMRNGKSVTINSFVGMKETSHESLVLFCR